MLLLLAFVTARAAQEGLPALALPALQIALLAGTTLLVEIALAHATTLRRPGSSRPAALLAGVAGAIVLGLVGGQGWLSVVLITIVGAVIGGMSAAWRIAGLWEDNFPPSPAVRKAVLEAHRDRPGFALNLPLSKRLFDLALAGTGALVAAPLIVLLAVLIWLEDPGPLFFVKNAVGLGGRNFRQWKLRTMVFGAEQATGPVRARDDDSRALRLGGVLRKTALDELPQLLNILVGDMSFVGPRPQRTVLVERYLQAIPEYVDRHCVRPGLAGLAQVAGSYHITPRQKLRLDRLYVRHAGLGFDAWLITLAFLVVFWWRWQDGWRGYLPPARIRGPFQQGSGRRARPSES